VLLPQRLCGRLHTGQRRDLRLVAGVLFTYCLWSAQDSAALEPSASPNPTPVPRCLAPLPARSDANASPPLDFSQSAATQLADDSKKNVDRLSCVNEVRAARREADRRVRTLKRQLVQPNAAADSGAAARLAAWQLLHDQLKELLKDQPSTNLQIDAYAATVYSTLYRDASKAEGLLSHSKPFFQLETRQTLAGIDMDVWGDIRLQTSAFEPSASTPTPTPTPPASRSRLADAPASNGIEATQSISFEAGPELHFDRGGDNRGIAYSAVAGAGAMVFNKSSGADDLAAQQDDRYKFTGRLGFIVRQTAGDWQNTFVEVSYRYDPTFQAANRFFLRGRLHVAPERDDGKDLGLYVEGSLNAGAGRDEARLSVGVTLNVLDVLRKLRGATGSASD
jgi:hypothetical protein